MGEPVGADDLMLAAGLAVDTLGSALDADWDAPAPANDRSCRDTLDHVIDVVLWYAAQLATHSREPLPWPRRGDPKGRVAFLLPSVQSSAAILAAVVLATDPSVRAFHAVGLADPEGFAAMGCDEILVHTDDLARGLGISFAPPEALCANVVARLFPWAPSAGDPWAELRWANGRIALPDRARLGPDWSWHCAPLAEWDGTVPRYTG